MTQRHIIDLSLISSWENHPFTLILKEALREEYFKEPFLLAQGVDLEHASHLIPLALAKLKGRQSIRKMFLEREELLAELEDYIELEEDDESNRPDKGDIR